MDFSKKLRGFLKTGRINTSAWLKNYLLEEENITGIERALFQLSENERNCLINEVWDELSEDKQRGLVAVLYFENWEKMISNYGQLQEKAQIRTLEMLGFIPHKDVVNFLIEQMKTKKESIQFTASMALKRQDPSLTLKPMLQALVQPDQWLPSRVFEVLVGIGPKLVEELTEMIEDVNEEVQQILVQVLGEIGDASCLPILERLLQSSNGRLRIKVSEALKQLGIYDSWPILAILLEDNQWQVRIQAAEALGIIGVKEAIPLLDQRRLLEKDPIVKECIEDALKLIEEVDLPIVVNWVRER